MEIIIEVGYKKGVFDAIGAGIKKDISDIGIRKAKRVSAHQLYLIRGVPNKKNIEFIAQNILCDPTVQDYRIVYNVSSGKGPSAQKGCFAVDVWFKKGVTDSVGESVRKAIEDLNIQGITELHTGRRVIIEGRIKRADAGDIATKLLANEVVEDYKIYG